MWRLVRVSNRRPHGLKASAVTNAPALLLKLHFTCWESEGEAVFHKSCTHTRKTTKYGTNKARTEYDYGNDNGRKPQYSVRLHKALLPWQIALLKRQTLFSSVTDISRGNFPVLNIHGYVKKIRRSAQTFNVEVRRVFSCPRYKSQSRC